MGPTEMAGLREVGGRGPGAESSQPEVIRALAKGVLKLQQAGANAAPVVSADHLLLHSLRVCTAHPVVVEGRYEVV